MLGLMKTMNVSIPEPMKEYVERRVTSGEYSSVSEYIRALVRDDRDRKAREKLEGLLLEGVNSGPPIRVSSTYWDKKRQLGSGFSSLPRRPFISLPGNRKWEASGGLTIRP